MVAALVLFGPLRCVRGGEPTFLYGVDTTMLTKVEQAGGVFSENGQPRDALEILRDRGVNAIRLRVFVDPDGKGSLVCNLDYVLPLAQRVKRAGLKFLLDLHYSDSWADPGSQSTPKAWAALDFPALKSQVSDYTRDTVAKLRAAGALPDYVQIGNETNTGMLWPLGKTVDADGWKRFAELCKAGTDGARAALGPGETIRFIHHVADPKKVVWHMDNFFKNGGETDVIGISWYPLFHKGDFDRFKERLAECATRYHKDIVIAETGYPWTTRGFDSYPEVMPSARPPLPGLPAYTPQGQADFMRELVAAVKSTPEGHGLGFFYWEGTWLPSARFGSPTDNTNLFDEKGAALPALNFPPEAR